MFCTSWKRRLTHPWNIDEVFFASRESELAGRKQCWWQTLVGLAPTLPDAHASLRDDTDIKDLLKCIAAIDCSNGEATESKFGELVCSHLEALIFVSVKVYQGWEGQSSQLARQHREAALMGMEWILRHSSFLVGDAAGTRSRLRKALALTLLPSLTQVGKGTSPVTIPRTPPISRRASRNHTPRDLMETESVDECAVERSLALEVLGLCLDPEIAGGATTRLGVVQRFHHVRGNSPLDPLPAEFDAALNSATGSPQPSTTSNKSAFSDQVPEFDIDEVLRSITDQLSLYTTKAKLTFASRTFRKIPVTIQATPALRALRQAIFLEIVPVLRQLTQTLSWLCDEANYDAVEPELAVRDQEPCYVDVGSSEYAPSGTGNDGATTDGSLCGMRDGVAVGSSHDNSSQSEAGSSPACNGGPLVDYVIEVESVSSGLHSKHSSFRSPKGHKALSTMSCATIDMAECRASVGFYNPKEKKVRVAHDTPFFELTELLSSWYLVANTLPVILEDDLAGVSDNRQAIRQALDTVKDMAIPGLACPFSALARENCATVLLAFALCDACAAHEAVAFSSSQVSPAVLAMPPRTANAETVAFPKSPPSEVDGSSSSESAVLSPSSAREVAEQALQQLIIKLADIALNGPRYVLKDRAVVGSVGDPCCVEFRLASILLPFVEDKELFNELCCRVLHYGTPDSDWLAAYKKTTLFSLYETSVTRLCLHLSALVTDKTLSATSRIRRRAPPPEHLFSYIPKIAVVSQSLSSCVLFKLICTLCDYIKEGGTQLCPYKTELTEALLSMSSPDPPHNAQRHVDRSVTLPLAVYTLCLWYKRLSDLHEYSRGNIDPAVLLQLEEALVTRGFYLFYLSDHSTPNASEQTNSMAVICGAYTLLRVLTVSRSHYPTDALLRMLHQVFCRLPLPEAQSGDVIATVANQLAVDLLLNGVLFELQDVGCGGSEADAVTGETLWVEVDRFVSEVLDMEGSLLVPVTTYRQLSALARQADEAADQTRRASETAAKLASHRQGVAPMMNA